MANQKPDLSEWGVTGLRRAGGFVLEEFLPQLQGLKAREVYREMSDNDPLIGGILLAFNEVLGRLDWHIEAPEKATPEEVAAAEFVQEAFEDMVDPWDVTLSTIMSMLIYGWSITEVCYKIRRGDNEDEELASKYDDGKIGWSKWAIRSQDSFLRWEFDQVTGRPVSMVQQDITTGMHIIPMEKAMLFRTNEYKGNPEGISLLRKAYTSWFYKKRIQEIEAIGIERDLAGLPVIYAPSEWFSSTADEGAKASLLAVQKLVTQVRRNESEGVVMPFITDEHGTKSLTFELLSSGGKRSFNTEAIIERYNKMIATSMLADFILLGQGDVGSFALGSQKIESWQMIVDSFAKSVASVVNKSAIDKLLRLNGMSVENSPRLVYGDIKTADLSVIGNYLKTLSDSGLLTPNDENLEAWAREQGNLPPLEQ